MGRGYLLETREDARCLVGGRRVPFVDVTFGAVGVRSLHEVSGALRGAVQEFEADHG